MRAKLAPRARREVSAAVAWIADENPEAAKGLVAALNDLARLIARHPIRVMKGRNSRDPHFAS